MGGPRCVGHSGATAIAVGFFVGFFPFFWGGVSVCLFFFCLFFLSFLSFFFFDGNRQKGGGQRGGERKKNQKTTNKKGGRGADPPPLRPRLALNPLLSAQTRKPEKNQTPKPRTRPQKGGVWGGWRPLGWDGDPPPTALPPNPSLWPPKCAWPGRCPPLCPPRSSSSSSSSLQSAVLHFSLSGREINASKIRISEEKGRAGTAGGPFLCKQTKPGNVRGGGGARGGERRR